MQHRCAGGLDAVHCPEELFTADGQLVAELKEMAPKGDRRMAMNPVTNGGIDPKPLNIPDWKQYVIDIDDSGRSHCPGHDRVR